MRDSALKPNYRKIPKALYGVMIAQFAIGGAIIPFIGILFRNQGLEYSQMSLIFLGGACLATFAPGLWGMLADRYIAINRLFVILNIFALSALLVFARQTEFFPIMFSFLTFSLFFQPSMHLINALSYGYLDDPKNQFGAVRAWGSAGWIVPSVVFFALLSANSNLSLSFAPYLAAGIAVLAAFQAAILPTIPPGAQHASDPDSPRVGYFQAMKRLLSDGNYITVLIAFLLVASSFNVGVLFGPPHMEELGTPTKWIGLIQSAGVALEVIALPFLKQLLRTRGYAFSMALGALCLFGRHMAFVLTDSLWVLSLSYLLLGAVIIFFHIAASIYVNEIASVAVRASAQTTLVMLGSGVGPTLVFATTAKLSADSPDSLIPVFQFAATMGFAAFVLLLVRARAMNRATRS